MAATHVEIPDFSDLSLAKIEGIKIGDKEYELREATGDVAARYRNAATKGAQMRDGTISVGGLGDLEPLLVHLCLFDKSGRQVPEETVRKWPNRVQSWLFTQAKKLSGITEDEEEEEDKGKKQQSDIGSGSDSAVT